MLKTRAWILLFALCLINGCLLPEVAGFKSLWLGFASVPYAVLCLGFGLDLARETLRPILRGKKRYYSDTSGTLIMLVCLIVMPLPLALVLATINFVLPGQMTSVHGFFEAWRVATSMTIVSAFLRLADYPISLRSIKQMFVEAYTPRRD